MNKWSPLLAVSLGTFMLLIDVTIVIVALPTVARDLHSGLADLQWVLDGYSLALAALLLGAGTIADRFGRRRTYLVGLSVFALASVACAAAPTPGWLIAGRIVQGAGAAAMYAMTIALLNVTYRGRDRGVAFGVWGAVSGFAAGAGPLAGGLITEHLDWRWVFLVNVPVSAVAIALTRRAFSESSGTRAARLDLAGAGTFTATAGLVTYGLIRADAHGWTSTPTLAMLALGGAALVGFVAIERRTREPMLDLGLLRRRGVWPVLVAALLSQAGAFAYLPYTSLWLQEIRHRGPVSAALVGSLPLSGAAFVVGALLGRVLHRIAPRLTIGTGLLLVCAGDLLQAVVRAGSPDTVLVPGLLVAGLGVGAATPVLASAALAAVPAARAGMAGGAVNTFRQLGFTLGVAVFGAVFQARLRAGVPGPAAYPPALAATLVVAGCLALLGAALVLVVLPGRRAVAAARPADAVLAGRR